MNEFTCLECHRYFRKKWGVSPIDDVKQMMKVYYKYPFNEPDKPLDYWRPQDFHSEE
jgi:hypothetical protein